MELKQAQCFLSKLVCCFVSILLHQTRKNQYKWGENIAKTGNIHNYILHVCGKNINKKQHTSFVKEHELIFVSASSMFFPMFCHQTLIIAPSVSFRTAN